MVFTAVTSSFAQKLNEMVNFERYASLNQLIQQEKNTRKSVVFIGNSITEGWVYINQEFFTNNNFIGRGISGETSPQLLLRYRKDVIELRPKAVVINIGTNDIAENTGPYNQSFTLDNIKSMAELADANGIKVILSSVLPVGEYPWRSEIKNVPEKVRALNQEIQKYAREKGYSYVDYFSAMCNEKGAMMDGLADDGVHPNKNGYKIMETLVKKEIDRIKR